MIIYTLPISGGFMPAQVQLLINLSEAGFRPDLVCGCSGGNVAAYLGVAANWDSKMMKTMMYEFCNSINIETKTRLSSLSILLGFFSKDTGMYDEIGIESFFKKNITASTNKNTEVWTGAYNKLSNKSVLFCNKSKHKSIVNPEKINCRMAGCEDLIFIDDDFHLLYLISKSTATIPMLLPDVYISQEAYIDGGMNWASPAVPLLSSLETNHHVVYIPGNNLDIPETNIVNGNVISETFQIFSTLTEGHLIQERFYIYNHFKNIISKHNLEMKHEHVKESSIDALKHFKNIIDNCDYSFLILQPLYNRTTKLYDVEYASVLRVMNLTKNYFTTELFYSHQPLE